MIEQHLKLLGAQMKDKVTGIEGMVDSVSFDAYGCVQATLRAKANDKGEIPQSHWFDVKRLEESGDRIMEAPPHFTTPPGMENGPADKPAFSSLPQRDKGW